MRTLVILLGLVLGLISGTALVLVNPLAWYRALPPLPADIAPERPYAWDDYRGIELSAADLLGVGRRDPDVALTSPALAQVRVGIVVLPAGDGRPAALAVKVAVVADDNSLWQARLGSYDSWNIFWPGEGSVFAAGFSNYWGMIRDSIFLPAGSGDPGAGARPHGISAQSPRRNSAGVTGAAGRYAGFTGEIRERVYPALPESGTGNVDWALALKAIPSPVGAR